MNEQDGQHTLTQAGYDALKSELEQLEAREVGQKAAYIDVNYSSDVSSEEAASDEVYDDLDRTRERIGHLKMVLEQAVIAEDSGAKVVDPGERVTVYDEETKETFEFTLIGGEEVIAGREGVAIDSPVGKALVGRRVGETVEAETPDGVVRYTIRKIAPGA